MSTDVRNVTTESKLHNKEYMLAIICHLTVFLGVFFATIVVLIIWLLKRKQSNFINHHGREAINFQLSMTLLGFILMWPTTYFLQLNAMYIVDIYIGILYVIVCILAIIAAIKAYKGVYYKYPYTIPFIKCTA